MALPKSGQLGTLFNWIGRSCYGNDVYLRKSMVSDFRLYKTALTDSQIMDTEMKVKTTIDALNAASAETPNALVPVIDSPYRVSTLPGEIKIQGLNGSEKISLIDISGRRLTIVNPATIPAKAGVYIVKINNTVLKVIVK